MQQQSCICIIRGVVVINEHWAYEWQKQPNNKSHHHHHEGLSLEAIATACHEVRSRARFKASEAERLSSVQTWCSQLATPCLYWTPTTGEQQSREKIPKSLWICITDYSITYEYADEQFYQYGVPMKVFRFPIVLSSCALTPKSTEITKKNVQH